MYNDFRFDLASLSKRGRVHNIQMKELVTKTRFENKAYSNVDYDRSDVTRDLLLKLTTARVANSLNNLMLISVFFFYYF